MCGILGYYCWGDARPQPSVTRNLMLANLSRGKDAAGLAYEHEGEILISKAPISADKFVEAVGGEQWERVNSSRIVLGHTRASTKGTEKENVNNHPVVGLGWVVTHNGNVKNDDELWAYFTHKEGVERFAEVDTSAIPLVLSQGNSLMTSLQHTSILSGAATFAAWPLETGQKDNVFLVRYGYNDLHMVYDEKTRILYWTSALEGLRTLPGIGLGGYKFMTWARLGDRHALWLSKEGIRTFTVDSKPFFRRKTYPASYASPKQAAPLASAPSPASSGGGRPARDPMKDLATTVTWTSTNDTLYPTKPIPITASFGAEWWGLSASRKRVAAPGVAALRNMITGYGRWNLETVREGKDNAAFIQRVFIPHTKTAAWWAAAFPGIKDVVFPMLDAKLDLLLRWEWFTVTYARGETSFTQIPGYMCPWCGIWVPASRFSDARANVMKLACEWCCVIGTLPSSNHEGTKKIAFNIEHGRAALASGKLVLG